MLNKRAQISEIMTWIIATTIILLMLLIFTYASSLLAQKTKTVDIKNIRIDLGRGIDWLETKNLIAYNSASAVDKAIMKKWEEDKKNEET